MRRVPVMRTTFDANSMSLSITEAGAAGGAPGLGVLTPAVERPLTGAGQEETRQSANDQKRKLDAVTAGHIGWADIIFLMEKSHLNRLRLKFHEALEGKRTVTLLIPDEYEYMQQELVEELTAKVSQHVTLVSDS